MSSISSTLDNEKQGPDANEKVVTLTTLEPVLEEDEVGYNLYKEARDENITWDANEEGAVRRKLDLYILPCFCLTQGLAYLDKTALNYANLFGMKADMHITTAQFSWFASIFYIGYLVSAEPMTWMLQRYPTGRVLGVICFLWGIVVIPGLGLMTPFWWTLNEQPYCFNGFAGIFGNFYRMASAMRHTSLGAITTAWGIFLFLTLPDSPAFAPFLSLRQKTIAVKRVASNRIGTKNKVFKYYQMMQAFEDPKTYLLFVASISAQIPKRRPNNQPLSIIISGMGFTKFETTLLDIPSNVIQIVSLILSGYLAGRFKNSRALMMVGMLHPFYWERTCIIAAAALTYAPHDQKWGRLVAFWFTSCQSVGFSLSLVMVSANVGGFTKRQVTTVITFINIAGPHVLLQSEAAIGYPTATKSMMAGYVVKTVCHLALGIYINAVAAGENISKAERARLAEEEGMKDITEFDNKWFRYVL
ncbi:major facilitator superfamily domain-containing protein [Mycena rebaudengoi]|nr:major facilitator superfamily domain-containing protein [Mycena rebaudengoi]